MGRGGINRGWIASSSIPTRSLFPEAGRTIVFGFVVHKLGVGKARPHAYFLIAKAPAVRNAALDRYKTGSRAPAVAYQTQRSLNSSS